MTALATRLFLLTLALALDRIVGDPAPLWRRVPHPVAVMGQAIGWLDRRLNVPAGRTESRRRGAFALVLLLAGAAAVGILLDLALAALPFGNVVEAIVVAIFLAQKGLIDHVAAVERGLASDADAGRRAVGEIVGRDVSILDEAGVARAAIESAAENFSDAVVAPALWYVVLGLPGLLLYKMANTADSMIGHLSPRYLHFGWAAARFDDLLNLLPARLSALLIAAAAGLVGRDARGALRTARRDAPRHRSPNAGWPEAALAGALGLALGGPRRYGSESVDGAWLNAGGRAAATGDDIRQATFLIDAAWALLLSCVAAMAIILLAIAR